MVCPAGLLHAGIEEWFTLLGGVRVLAGAIYRGFSTACGLLLCTCTTGGFC